MVRLKPLAEQIIVITGATSGIGLAAAEGAVAAGARVVLSARNTAALDALQTRFGARAATVAGDIADPETPARIVDAAVAAFGSFDTWVNNAAAATVGRLTDTADADHKRIFDVGYFGTVRGSMAAVEHLRERGGALINVGSIESDRAAILQGPYSAMKHAIKGFTEALRTEVEADRLPISVTLIKPAAMHTPFPEHARNLTGHPVTLPPVIYDPRLTARAILFAAANPRRDLSVGGMGVLEVMLALHFPRVADILFERFGEALQTIDQPPPPDRVDNLWEPRAGTTVESAQRTHVRRKSLWLEAQLRPKSAAAALGGAAMAAALGLAAVRRLARSR